MMAEVGQAPPPKTSQTPPPAAGTNKDGVRVITIINSNRLIHRNNFIPQVLKDSVIFLHDGAYLYCDSAYWNESENSFEAFGRVRMEQGDTLFLYGKYMHYDGNLKLVKVRREVVMEHIPQNVTLFTDSLNYDRMMNLGYYFDGGMLVDTLNELTSFWGQYEPNINMATFRDSVVLTNPQFKLYSDRLRYDTRIKTAYISTPTVIESDSGIIYTSNGWYNTDTEESLLLDQSTVVNKEGNRFLKGDSIFYYKAQGYGEVFGNMLLQDTVKKVILRGHYGYYDELNDFALATDSAFAIEYSQSDSLFIHADTLKLIGIADTVFHYKQEPLMPADSTSLLIKDSLANTIGIDSLALNAEIPTGEKTPVDSIAHIQLADSLPQLLPVAGDSLPALPPIPIDTTITMHRQIKAYYGVRFYRSDMQGICDSLQFDSKDSILHMYKDPVIWNTNRQLSGDTIDIHMNDSTINFMHVKRYSFSIEEKDSIHFNQLKSRSLKVYFEDKKVRRVLAEGNVETITYPEEKDKSLSKILNYLTSSYLDIYMENGAFTKLVAWPQPVGKTTPFHLLLDEQLRLSDFYWFDYLRPTDRHDIFRKTKKKAEDSRPQRSDVFKRQDDEEMEF
ncbi:hypothetical protein D0T57_09490 [Dysgonomonas sp. 511]|nr:hypothetical protein [Dysgonomonas sp. 511]